ncbi:Fur family transcriptional regulator [Isachenkonia alkalipeptolytica]|nr:transcriptional repressor [Isachenkonia alkalipeptolytica]
MQDSIEYKLREQGYKITEQRKIIIEAFVKTKNHLLSAEKVYDWIKDHGQRIDLSTIYRNIEIMLNIGVLKKISLDNHVDQYKLSVTNEHHHHIVCVSCGKSEIFKDCPVLPIEKNLIDKLGFTPIEHKLEILGYCKKCTWKSRD